jgi:signal transduction histidine kinase
MIYASVLIAVSLLNILLGYSVHLKVKSFLSKRFFIFASVMGFWVFFYGVSFIFTNHALLTTRLIVFAAIFIPSSFHSLCKAIQSDDEHFSLLELLFHSSITVILLLTIPTQLFITTAQFINDSLVFTYGFSYSLQGIYILLGMGLGFLTLYFKYKEATTNDQKTQLKLIAAGMIGATIIGLTFSFILPLLGFIQYNKFTTMASIFFLLSFAYAITKYELMDIQVIIGRTLSFILVSSTLVLSFLILFFFAEQKASVIYLGSILLALFWAFYGLQIQETLITTATRKFIKGWYSFDACIAELSKKFIAVFSFEDAFKVVEEALKAIEISTVYTLIPRIQNNRVESYYINEIDVLEDISLDHPIIEFFRHNHDIHKEDRIPQSLKNILANSKYLTGEVYIPMYASNELMGIVIVGKKESKKEFDTKDMSLFSTLTGQMTIVLDRIRPYEQIQQEFNRTQKQIFDAERMYIRSKTIESLMHTIQEYNHELNTPLQAISTYSNRLPNDPGIKESKDMIIKAYMRAKDIVRTTLRLLGQDDKELLENNEKEKSVHNINAVIKELVKTLIFDKNIEFIDGMHEEPLRVFCSDKDLQTAVSNLIQNATEAMPEGGKLRLRTFGKDGFANIEVKDTGVGIKKDFINDIWNPFKSSHVTKGRGLGLSIVNRLIVVEHGGKVDVQSIEGKGATFTISLPLIA